MHSRWAFQWRRKEKASNMVEYVFLKIFFWWYRSVACVYFSQQLPLHLLLSKLIFMQLLWTNCLWTSQTFFPFYRPKSSALNNVWIHQHQLKNMSLSQQSTGIKMSNWTEEVMEFMPCWSVQRIESSTKTWLFPLQYAFWIETNQSREGSRTFDPFQLKALKEICSCQFKSHSLHLSWDELLLTIFKSS